MLHDVDVHPPAPSFASAWAVASTAEGWLTEAQGRALFEAARAVPEGQWIVEIGSHHGRSTVLLAAAKPQHVRLLAVDPFDDPRWGGGPEAMECFRATLAGAGMEDQVSVFVGLSAEAANSSAARPVGLLHVDGAHDRDSVLQDIDGWQPRLADEATIFFHDAYSSSGVTIAMFTRLLGSRRHLYAGSERSLARMRYGRFPITTWCLSRARMIARLGWFARNLTVKIALGRGWTPLLRVLRHRDTSYPY